MDLVLVGVVSCIVSAFFCMLFAFALHTFRMRDVNLLYARVESLEMALRGEKGRSARAEKAERQSAAMAEAAAMLQTGQQPQDILKTLIAKYPDVAADMAKKAI